MQGLLPPESITLVQIGHLVHEEGNVFVLQGFVKKCLQGAMQALMQMMRFEEPLQGIWITIDAFTRRAVDPESLYRAQWCHVKEAVCRPCARLARYSCCCSVFGIL